MQYTPKVSVILPVYNVAPWIGRCIESLKAQKLKGLEFIFVDDCSTDGSMVAVEEWAAQDERVRILRNEENLGAGPSRNRGIEVAQGECLSFVDPDDYVADDFFELLYACTSEDKPDIVKGKCIMQRADGCIVSKPKDLNTNIRKGLDLGKPLYTLFTYEHHGTLFRTDYIRKNKIRYGNAARAQDTVFLLRACIYTDRFDMNDAAYYYFCEREESAMHRTDPIALEGIANSVHDFTDEVTAKIKDEAGAIICMDSILQFALREYERYATLEGMGKVASDYLLSIRNEMMQLPFCDALSARSFSLRMLKENGLGIPREPYKSPWEMTASPEAYTQLIIAWRKALAAYPHRWRESRRELTNIINHAEYSCEVYAHSKPLETARLKREINNIPLQIRGYHSLRSFKRYVRKLFTQARGQLE